MTQSDPGRSEDGAYQASQISTSELERCRTQLTETRREADEIKDRYLRAAAEVANVRKQVERDAAIRYVQEKRRFLREFLDVADSLERALSQPGAPSGLYEGVRLALGQLYQALAHPGVERMAVKPGDTFDPVYHEAIEVILGEGPHDTVAEVVRGGYLHEGMVLRPASVIVARSKR